MMRRLGSSSYVHVNIVIQAEQTNNDNVTLRIICRPVKHWSCDGFFCPCGLGFLWPCWRSCCLFVRVVPKSCTYVSQTLVPEPGWQDTTQEAVELFLGTVSAFKFKMQSTRI